jgi:hypothetical protein
MSWVLFALCSPTHDPTHPPHSGHAARQILTSDSHGTCGMPARDVALHEVLLELHGHPQEPHSTAGIRLVRPPSARSAHSPNIALSECHIRHKVLSSAQTHNKSEARTRNSERKVTNSAGPAHVHPFHAAHEAAGAAACISTTRPHRAGPCGLRCALPSCSPGE